MSVPGAHIRVAPADLTGMGGAERELRRLRATLEVQREVTEAASDRDTVLKVVAERVVDLFEAADGAAVESLDGDVLYVEAASGALASAVGSEVAVAGSLAGLALTGGVPVHCTDAAADDRVNRDFCRRYRIGSMIVAPLRVDKRVVGSLKVTAGRPGAFDAADGEELGLLAESLGGALRHADDAARNLALLVERTGALDMLEASETRFRLAFENSPLGLSLISLAERDAGRYLHVNPAMTAITGYTASELGRMTYRELLHPDDIPDRAKVLAAIEAAGPQPIRAEHRYRHKDGHLVWVSVRAAAVRDDYGRPLYLVNQVEDVTTQREVLAETRRQARMLEMIPAAVIVRELDGTIRWWNEGASRLYGWPLDAAAGKVSHRLLSTVFPEGATVHDQIAGLLRDQQWAGQLDHLTATGDVVTVLSRQVLHHPEHGRDQVLEINTDVTAARAADQRLAESEQRFRAQFTFSATGQVVHNLDGRFGAVNPAFAALVGRTVAELTGSRYRDLLHPEDQAVSEREIAGLFAGEGDSFTREGRIRHADGQWIDVTATVSMVRDPSGRPLHLIGMIADISDRRAAERARQQTAAALAERNAQLEAANQLKLDIIGMLGHEIGNPLSSIRGYAEVLTEDWAGLSDARRERSVEAIARQAGRLDEIVREVLAMVTIDAGTITPVRAPVNLRDEIRRAVDEAALPVRGDDVWALCHPGHLQQILANLLSNAAKYGGGATGVTVTGGDGRARLRVEGRGPGVPEEFRDRLFDRLARAERDAGSVRGTGLGLYIVRGLAHANQADVRYEPNPGGGSAFVIDLEETDRPGRPS